jgi:hypothetical protein
MIMQSRQHSQQDTSRVSSVVLTIIFSEYKIINDQFTG